MKTNMKTGYILDSSRGKDHIALMEALTLLGKQYGEILQWDMADQTPEHLRFREIRDARCDLLITLDCAGYSLRTENDTLSLNNLGCRMAHVLRHGIKDYKDILSLQHNFSMFVYVPNQEDVKMVRENYPNIPNIGLFPGKKEADGQERDARLEAWMNEILQEMELQ